MLELVERAQIADSQVKGYKYTCANAPKPCLECEQQLVAFITQDLDEAYKHSVRNSVAMWISKD